MATRKYDKTRLDLQNKKSNEVLEFFISDDESCDFYIRLSRAGIPIDTDKSIAVLCVVDPNNQVRSQFINTDTNKNGIVYCKLEKSMKTIIGTYHAKVMLISEKEKVVTDTFTYNIKNDMFVGLNEEIVVDERFHTLNDMLSEISIIKNQEADRVISENDRVATIERIKNEISQLIIDINGKINSNILENTSKTDTLISNTKATIDEMVELNTIVVDDLIAKGNNSLSQLELTSSNLVADVEKHKVDSTNAIELYKVTKDGEINKAINDYQTSTTANLNLLTNGEILKIRNEMNSTTDTFKTTIGNDFTKLGEELRLNVNDFVASKESYINSHLNGKSLELTKYIEDKNVELNTYVNGKTTELNEFVGAKNLEVSNFISTKTAELESYKTEKTAEINKYFSDKETEFTSAEKIRNTSENRRETNEYSRGLNELNRKNAEDKRIAEFNSMKLSFSQMLKFNTDGNLEVTINGITKTFTPN